MSGDPGPWPFVVVPTSDASVAISPAGDNGVPWPFKLRLERIGSIEEDRAVWLGLIKSVLLGKSCRVIRPGSDVGRTEIAEQAVNIHLSDSGHVENVTFG